MAECSYLVFFFLILFAQHNDSTTERIIPVSELKYYHKAFDMKGDMLAETSGLCDDMSAFHRCLSNILIPRVVGSANHDKVKKYLINEMKQLDWHIEKDSFYDNTPIFGKLKFENIIATHNPNAKRFLDLACHYDSKYFREHSFLGATDSAVPCAMMVQIASSLNDLLNKNKNEDLSLRFIFFDGEEAFKTWGPKDSLYGARHLAEKWYSTPYPDGGTGSTQLDRMDMLVLLDLIGHSNPSFYSFFRDTEGWYMMLANVEDKLAKEGLLKDYHSRYVLKQSSNNNIEDDHIPFLRKNVPIMHLISVPFPREWHTPHDNADVIDVTATQNLIKVLAVFVAQYMHLMS